MFEKKTCQYSWLSFVPTAKTLAATRSTNTKAFAKSDGYNANL